MSRHWTTLGAPVGLMSEERNQRVSLVALHHSQQLTAHTRQRASASCRASACAWLPRRAGGRRPTASHTDPAGSGPRWAAAPCVGVTAGRARRQQSFCGFWRRRATSVCQKPDRKHTVSNALQRACTSRYRQRGPECIVRRQRAAPPPPLTLACASRRRRRSKKLPFCHAWQAYACVTSRDNDAEQQCTLRERVEGLRLARASPDSSCMSERSGSGSDEDAELDEELHGLEAGAGEAGERSLPPAAAGFPDTP